MSNESSTTRPPKTLTDRNGHTIKEGTIVRVTGEGEGGWMEVRSVWKGSQTVNLGPIFHGPLITKKQVPLAEVYEDHDAWYAHWQTTDTYRCM